MVRARIFPFGVVLAALVLATPLAWADRWYEHYSRAETALAEEDHQKAIDELTLALERRGDSGARVRTYGMRVTAYFPYFKLGIAYVQAGEYEAALRAFDTEERLGAIAESDNANAELQQYRRVAADALEGQRNERQDAVDRIVRESMDEARRLRRAGQASEALSVVARALSLAPEDPEVIELATALREELTRSNEERTRREHAAVLIEQGKQFRSDGRLADSAARFRQALELAAGGGADELLREVQAELALQTAVVSPSGSTVTMQQAEDLLSSNQPEAALALVQEVIATAPGDRVATNLERRILAHIDQENRAAEINRLLDDTRNLLAAGEYEEAIAAANLLLGKDRGNIEALELIRKAYGDLSRRLLGAGSVQDLPPAIRFADMRVGGPDGSLVHILRQPDFVLSGVVIDDSEVALTVSLEGGIPVRKELSSQMAGGVQITEFRLDAKLPAGAHVLSVVATDPHGQSTRSEYAVRYDRPLLRSPWLWVSLLLIPLLFAAVQAARRLAVRRRLLRRRFNPFVAGPPVFDPALFFGRGELLDRVLATVPNNSLLLLGERRIGKTSLLHQLRLRLHELEHPRFDFLPVSVDLQGVPEGRFFSTVAEAIGETVDDQRMMEAQGDDGYGSRELVHDLRRVLPTLPAGNGKRTKLVLLLDEIDELNGYSHRTNQRLRSLFMRSFADQLVAVAAGVGIARQWEHEGSPWYNFFEELEVGPVDADAAWSLVTRPLNGVIEIDDVAVDRLLLEARGRPYILQKLALAVVLRVHEHGRRRITVADVVAVVEVQSEREDARNRGDRRPV